MIYADRWPLEFINVTPKVKDFFLIKQSQGLVYFTMLKSLDSRLSVSFSNDGQRILLFRHVSSNRDVKQFRLLKVTKLVLKIMVELSKHP